MLKEERQQKIINVLYEEGKISVDLLAQAFITSKDTIRRDLSELEEQGILKRVYGGAIPKKQLPFAIDERKRIEKNEKYIVAKKAVGFIKPESMIAIDGGTTNTIFASLMPLSINLRIVTNSFLVAQELRKRPNVDVTFLGGRYNKASQTTVGEMAFQQLKGFYFDQCFIGAYGVDSRVGVSVPYPYEDETAIKKYFVENSAEVNIMSSCSKLEKTTNYIICPIKAIDRIICEHPVTEQMQEKYQNKIY